MKSMWICHGRDYIQKLNQAPSSVRGMSMLYWPVLFRRCPVFRRRQTFDDTIVPTVTTRRYFARTSISISVSIRAINRSSVPSVAVSSERQTKVISINTTKLYTGSYHYEGRNQTLRERAQNGMGAREEIANGWIERRTGAKKEYALKTAR